MFRMTKTSISLVQVTVAAGFHTYRLVFRFQLAGGFYRMGMGLLSVLETLPVYRRSSYSSRLLLCDDIIHQVTGIGVHNAYG